MLLRSSAACAAFAFFGFFAAFAACAPEGRRDAGEAIAFSLSATLQPGEERTFCKFVRMPPSADGEDELFVRGGRHAVSEGGHHLLLYRTRRAVFTDDMDRVVPCDEHDGVLEDVTTYVTGGQAPGANADFPAGTALPFRPGEILLLQGHFINPSRTAREAKIELSSRTTRASAVEHRAGVLRFYDPFIVVPPRASARATMQCKLRKDVTLLSAAAHMHARGVKFAAYVDPPSGPPSTTPFYTTDDGVHPDVFLGYVRIPAGSTLRFACDYRNDDDHVVVQGLSATRDEMCMLSAFYFPAMDRSDEACADMRGHGTGAASCAETTECLERCPPDERPDFSTGDPRVGACWQRCITASCPNVTETLFPQLSCTASRCETECREMGERCRACVRERCAAELDRCQRLACGP